MVWLSNATKHKKLLFIATENKLFLPAKCKTFLTFRQNVTEIFNVMLIIQRSFVNGFAELHDLGTSLLQLFACIPVRNVILFVIWNKAPLVQGERLVGF